MIGLLVVSHSPLAAEGIVNIARQMSGGSVPIRGTGGNEKGALGTSVPFIVESLTRLLEEAEGVVILPDLGSAVLSATSALEFVSGAAGKVVLADGPVLEGAMMASIEASLGSPLDKVLRVAEEAHGLKKLSEEQKSKP